MGTDIVFPNIGYLPKVATFFDFLKQEYHDSKKTIT